MDRYHRQVAAARKAGLELTRRQQAELSSVLEDFADELGDRIRSGFGTTNDVLLEREIRNLIRELHSGISSHILKHSRLQARAMSEMHARAHNDALSVAGLTGEAFENRMAAVSANLAQAVFARDGITGTFRTLRRGTAQQAQLILKRASIRGSSIDSVERQMRLLVQGAESIPEELLIDRRLISKRTLTEYFGIDSPTNEEVAAVRRAARAVAGRSRLISRTEMMNVEQEATAIAMAQSPIVEAGQWFLSSRHSDFDQCDALATSDFYELGSGVYPSDAIPPRPHPRCLCGVEHILRDPSQWGTPKKRGVKLQLNPKREAKRLGLNGSQTRSLQSALGIAEVRGGSGRVKRRNLPDKTGLLAFNALRSRARVLRALGPNRNDQLGKLSMLGSFAKAGLIARAIGVGTREYLAIVGAAGAGAAAGGAGLVATRRAARRRAATDVPRMRSGGAVRDEYNRRFSVRDADGKRVGLARGQLPPVPPVRDNLKRNLKDMEEWLANESVEYGVAYDKNGRLLYIVQGDANSLPNSKLLGTSLEGATVTHNHAPWATDYLNPATYYSLPFSKHDIAWAMQRKIGASRVASAFRTYSIRPRRNGSWSHGDWFNDLDVPDPNRNSFRWRTVRHTADGPTVRTVLDDISSISIDERYDSLEFTLKLHLNSKSKAVGASLIRPTGLDPGEWDFDVFKADRFAVYGSDADMLAARAAGQIRAVTEMQFEEIIREHIWKQLAREFNWEYVSTLRPKPLLLPHRTPLLPFEVANWSDRHAKLFTVGLKPSKTHEFDVSTFGLHPPDFDSQIARELRAGGQASKWSVIPRIRRKPFELTLNVSNIPLPRLDRLRRLDLIRATLTSTATVSRQAALTVAHEVREAFGLVPDSMTEFLALLAHPMRIKETLDDLLLNVGKYVPDRWMATAVAYRSRAHYELDRLHRNRTPGRRTDLESFPELRTPAAGQSLLDENIDAIDDWLTAQTHESVFILDRHGRPITFRQGSTGTVPLTQVDRVLMEGATVVHNHTAIMGNLTFSPEDLFELAQGRARRGVLVTRRFRYTITPGKLSFLPDDFLHDAFEELDELRRRALDKIMRDNYVIATHGQRSSVPFARQAAAITLDEAEEAALHAAMQQLSTRRGWTYARIERGVPNLAAAALPLDPISAARAAALISRDYDRVTALTTKRNRLRTLSAVFDDLDPARAATFAARADEIDVLLLTGVDAEVGWLNAPRWLRRSAEQAADDHGLAETIFMRLDEVKHFLFRPVGQDTQAAFQRAALRWRDRVEPKLRALGFPQEPFTLPSGLGQGMRSTVPLSTSRDLSRIIVRELDDLEDLKFYANQFSDEFGFNIIAMHDDIDVLDNIDFEAILFGAGGDNLPDSIRMIAKHKIQRETTIRLVDAIADEGVFDFWEAVRKAERGVPFQIEIDEIRLELLKGQAPPMAPTSAGVINRMIGPAITEEGRESLRRILLDIADDLDAGIITADPSGLLPAVTAPMFEVLKQLKREGKDLAVAANAIRVEVGTHTAARKWRSVKVDLGTVMRRNTVEELVDVLGGFDDLQNFADIFEEAARELSDEVLIRAIHRAQLRTLQERTVAGIMDSWAATSGRTPAAIAFQLAVDKEMGLSRAMKKHLGADALPPQRKTFIQSFKRIHERSRLEFTNARDIVKRREFLIESLEAIREDILDVRLKTFKGRLADQELFSEGFVARLVDDLNSGKRDGFGIIRADADGVFTAQDVGDQLEHLMQDLRGNVTAVDDIAVSLRNLGASPRDRAVDLHALEDLIDEAIEAVGLELVGAEKLTQKARRALREFELKHSVPIPAEQIAATARIERLRESGNKLALAVGEIQEKLKNSPLSKLDPEVALRSVQLQLQDLLEKGGEIIGTKEALRFSVTRSLSGDVRLGIVLRSDELTSSITDSFLTLKGSPLTLNTNVLVWASNHLPIRFRNQLTSNKFAAFLRTWNGVDDAAVIRFAQDLGLETGEIAKLTSTAQLAKGQLEALDIVKGLLDDDTLESFIALVREDVEALQKYITGGQLERDKILFVRLEEVQALANKARVLRDKAIRQQLEFFTNAPQHAMFGNPDTPILDIAKFQEAIRDHLAASKEAMDAGMILFIRDEQVLRRVVRDIYEQTQKALQFAGPRAPSLAVAKGYAIERAREAGFAKIILGDGEVIIVDSFRARLRGARTLNQSLISGGKRVEGIASVAWRDVMGADKIRDVTKPLQDFILWRGVGLPENVADAILSATDDFLGRISTLRFQPLSSFSTSPITAGGFVRSNQSVGQIGAMHMVRVDRRKIFSTPFTGPGCLCEHEFTILGGKVNTLTLRDSHTRINWWEALGRLRLSGLVTKTELAEWARFTRLTMLNKSSLIPDDSVLGLLGLKAAIDVDDVREAIEDAFNTDWFKFEEFWNDVVRGDAASEALLESVRDHFLHSPSPELNSLLDRRVVKVVFGEEFAKTMPEGLVGNGLKVVQWLGDEGADLQELWEYVQWEIGKFSPSNLQRFGDDLSDEFIHWYERTYFEQFESEWLQAAQEGFVPSGDLDNLDALAAAGLLGVDVVPDLTQ